MGPFGPELPESFGGLGGLRDQRAVAEQIASWRLQRPTSICSPPRAGRSSPITPAPMSPGRMDQVVTGRSSSPSPSPNRAPVPMQRGFCRKAVRDGNDFILSGEKTSISMATQADVAVVFARTGSEADGARGISAFLVPMDLPGVSRTAFDDIGTPGRPRFDLSTGAHLEGMMLGDEGQGFIQVSAGFRLQPRADRPAMHGRGTGVLDETWRYIQEREAFGADRRIFRASPSPLAERKRITRPAAPCVCVPYG